MLTALTLHWCYLQGEHRGFKNIHCMYVSILPGSSQLPSIRCKAAYVSLVAYFMYSAHASVSFSFCLCVNQLLLFTLKAMIHHFPKVHLL